MFDTIIIGTGPAGISAALTLKQLNKNLLSNIGLYPVYNGGIDLSGY